jgi:hypothetical protein
MPCIGVLATALNDDAEGRAIIVGRISGVNTSAFAAGDEIYVAVGGGYTKVPPASESNVIQFLGTVTSVDSTQGGGIVKLAPPRAESNLNNGNVFIGNANNSTVTAALSTSIVPEGTNLYYSNTRVNAFIQSDITTTDIDEGTNLYYSNARVNAFIQSDITTTDIDEGSNLYFTDARSNTAVTTYAELGWAGNIIPDQDNVRSLGSPSKVWKDIYVSGGSIIIDGISLSVTGNSLFFGENAVAVAGDTNYTTDNLTEGNTNLYYSNARVNAFIQNSITTTDIDEGTNLYYSNARVTAHIATVPLSVGGNLIVNGNLEVQGNIDYVNVQDLQVVDNKIILNYGNATAREAFIIVDRSGSALSNAQVKWNEADDRWEINDGTNTYIVPRSTTDLTEGTNLYYSNTRVNAFIQSSITTTDIDEGANLYYSNARVNAFIQSDITTTDIDEGTNLYYTDARANTAIGAYQGNINTVGNITTTTNINANEIYANIILPADEQLQLGVGATATVLLGDLVAVDGDLFEINAPATTFYNDVRVESIANIALVETDTIITPSGVSYIYLPGINSGSDFVIVNGDGGAIKLSNADEVGVTIHSNAAVDSAGNITAPFFKGNGSLLTGLPVSYTNANVITLLGTYGNAISSNANITTTANVQGNFFIGNGSALTGFVSKTANVDSVNGATGVVVLDTDDVAEGTANLYFSNARVNAFIQSDITTTDIDEGTNLYYSNARVNAFIQSDITTTDIDEGTNLYYTDARANSAIVAYQGNIDTVGNIEAAYFIGNGSQLTGLPAGYTDANVITLLGTYGNAISSNANITTNANVITNSIRALNGNAMLQYDTATNITRLTTASNDPLTPQVMGTSAIFFGGGAAIANTGFISASGSGTVSLTATTISQGYSVHVTIGNIGNRAEYVTAAGETLNDAILKLKLAVDAKNISGITTTASSVADPTVTDSVLTITNNGVSGITLETAAFTGGTPAGDPPKLLLGNFNGVGLTVNQDGTISGNTNITTTGDIQGNFVKGNGSLLTGVFSNVKLQQFAETVVALGNVSGDISSNINLALGSIFTMTATGNITINSMGNANPGVSATLIITQDATGSRLLTSNWRFAGNDDLLSNAANSTDIVTALFAGGVYYATISKGYV